MTSKTLEGCSEKFAKKYCLIYFRVYPNFKVYVCSMFGCPYALDKTRSRWNVVSDYLDDHFLGSGLFEIKYLCHWQTVWVSANSRLNLTWLCMQPLLDVVWRNEYPKQSLKLRLQKSDNLQYDTVGQWIEGMIVLPSDGPMFILIDSE